MDENALLLQQLLGELPENVAQSTADLKQPFTADSVCKHALVGICPSQLLQATNKAQAIYRCTQSHHPGHKVQFTEAYQQYVEERKRSEPQWDGQSDGDPWGYTLSLERILYNEVKQRSIQCYKMHQRKDVLKQFIVDDDDYNNIQKQITLLYDMANKLASLSLENIADMTLYITKMQDLERKRDDMLITLINEQFDIISQYNEMKKSGQNPTHPPFIVDISSIIGYKYDIDNPQDINSAKDVLHILGGLRMITCDTCSGLMNTQEEYRRVTEHLTGRVHLAYRDIKYEYQRVSALCPLPATIDQQRGHEIFKNATGYRSYRMELGVENETMPPSSSSSSVPDIDDTNRPMHPWAPWALGYKVLTERDRQHERKKRREHYFSIHENALIGALVEDIIDPQLHSILLSTPLPHCSQEAASASTTTTSTTAITTTGSSKYIPYDSGHTNDHQSSEYDRVNHKNASQNSLSTMQTHPGRANNFTSYNESESYPDSYRERSRDYAPHNDSSSRPYDRSYRGHNNRSRRH